MLKPPKGLLGTVTNSSGGGLSPKHNSRECNTSKMIIVFALCLVDIKENPCRSG